MIVDSERETLGAWIIHHGRKIALDANGAAEFASIDEAAKAATLLTKLGQTENDELSQTEVRAVAVSTGINPRHELNGLLDVLARKRLVDVSDQGVSVLGVTGRAALRHASDIFDEAEPTPFEDASITLAERASAAPIRKTDLAQVLGDTHRLTTADVDDFLSRAEEIGFVDWEGAEDDRIFFNGNLFRRGGVEKSKRVLESLSPAESTKMLQFQEMLGQRGCVEYSLGERELGPDLFSKLIAASVFDLNTVQNESGTHVYITSPSSFHKFVDPLIDDCFDLAKALVAALTYGMSSRSAKDGRIQAIGALLAKLLRGEEVGPAPAIGEDYRVLETQRVIKLRRHPTWPKAYFMKLLKREVGELALRVLSGSGNLEVGLTDMPSASMSGYLGPERSRVERRRKQTSLSKRATRDVLESMRGGHF